MTRGRKKRPIRKRRRGQKGGFVRSAYGKSLPLLFNLYGKLAGSLAKKVKKAKGLKKGVSHSLIQLFTMVRRTRKQRTIKKRKRRRGQSGGILPLALIPLLALAGKAAASGAIAGAAGYGVKKGLEAATKKKK